MAGRSKSLSNPTRIVVLGGGYAGLAFIQGLRQTGLRNLEITLVDRNSFHTLLTETHSVAAGTRAPALVEVPFSVLDPEVNVVNGSVVDVDTENHLVLTESGNLPYDTLAFCLGGKDNDFGIAGVSDNALFLRGTHDAEQIRTRFETLAPGSGVVIVGGGLTGVELASEMAMRNDRKQQITVVEGLSNVLPGLTPALQQRARRRLGWLGVNVLANARVSRIDEGQVHLADGSVLTAGLIVWAAGVKGHPLLARMGVDVDRAGRASVDPFLRTNVPDVYVLGDSAVYRLDSGSRPLPPSAQLAEQMGFAAAADLAARMEGHNPKPFKPHLKGVLCDLGGLNASGLVFRFHIHGRLGAVAKRSTVFQHLWRTTGLKGFMRHVAEHLQHRALPAADHEAR